MKHRIPILEKIHKYLFENYRGVVAHVHLDREKIRNAFEKEHVWYRCSGIDGWGYDSCGIYYYNAGLLAKDHEVYYIYDCMFTEEKYNYIKSMLTSLF